MKTRTEEQMKELILGFAERDDRIRVVWMNGSLAFLEHVKQLPPDAVTVY